MTGQDIGQSPPKKHLGAAAEEDGNGQQFAWHSSEGIERLISALDRCDLKVLSQYLTETSQILPMVRHELALWMNPKSRDQQWRLKAFRRRGAPADKNLGWKRGVIYLVYREEEEKSKDGWGSKTALLTRVRKHLQKKYRWFVGDTTVRNIVSEEEAGR